MKYKIAYQYEMAGEIEIEASSLEEAKNLTKENIDQVLLRKDFVVEGSFKINESATNFLNEVR